MISVSGFTASLLATRANEREAFPRMAAEGSSKNFGIRSLPFSPSLLSTWRVSSLTFGSWWMVKFLQIFNRRGMPNFSEDIENVVDQ